MSYGYGKWQEDSVQNTQKKRVNVSMNGVFDKSKSLFIEQDWTCLDFLIAASQRLEIVPAANRVFNADGVEIDDCMMVEDNDMLFLSTDAEFIAPPDTAPGPISGSPKGDRGAIGGGGGGSVGRDHEKLPGVIGGYKVTDFLGKGAFGEVRVGEHQLTAEKVALKFLRKSDIMSIGAAERTTTEIQCLTTLRHTNIIRLQQHLESANHVVLVFELMEGGDLLKYLLQQGSTPMEMSLSEEKARSVFHQLIGAVSYAHNQHICHRDLKLENILLKGSTLACVKIADFGLSDFYRPGATMKSSCGTLSFLAPEGFKGTSNAGPPLDVWSLGVILFAILCGRLPFEGIDLSGKNRPRDQVIKSKILRCQYKADERLGPEAKDLIRRMLKLDPTERASIPEIFNHCWLRSSSSHPHISDTPPAASTTPTKATFFPRVPSSGRLDLAVAAAGGGVLSSSPKTTPRLLSMDGEDDSKSRGDHQEAIFFSDSSLSTFEGSRSADKVASPLLSSSPVDTADEGNRVALKQVMSAWEKEGGNGDEPPQAQALPSFRLVPLRRSQSLRATETEAEDFASASSNDSRPSSSSSSSSSSISSSSGISTQSPKRHSLPLGSPGIANGRRLNGKTLASSSTSPSPASRENTSESSFVSGGRTEAKQLNRSNSISATTSATGPSNSSRGSILPPPGSPLVMRNKSKV